MLSSNQLECSHSEAWKHHLFLILERVFLPVRLTVGMVELKFIERNTMLGMRTNAAINKEDRKLRITRNLRNRK